MRSLVLYGECVLEKFNTVDWSFTVSLAVYLRDEGRIPNNYVGCIIIISCNFHNASYWKFSKIKLLIEIRAYIIPKWIFCSCSVKSYVDMATNITCNWYEAVKRKITCTYCTCTHTVHSYLDCQLENKIAMLHKIATWKQHSCALLISALPTQQPQALHMSKAWPKTHLHPQSVLLFWCLGPN